MIQGPWLMDEMKGQAEAVGTEMIQDHISKVDLTKKPFTATGDSGQVYTADSSNNFNRSASKMVKFKI